MLRPVSSVGLALQAPHGAWARPAGLFLWPGRPALARVWGAPPGLHYCDQIETLKVGTRLNDSHGIIPSPGGEVVDWFPHSPSQTGTGGGDRTLQLEVKFFDLQETDDSEGILQKCFHLSSVKAGGSKKIRYLCSSGPKRCRLGIRGRFFDSSSTV